MAAELNILVAGANGIIGKNITPVLERLGEVYKLGKSVIPGKKIYKIDLIDKRLVDGFFSKANSTIFK